MQVRIRTAAVVMCAAFATLWCFRSPAKDDFAPKRIPISAEEIRTRYVVIGPLGRPLGEVLTVDARVVPYIGKGEHAMLRIYSVNGAKLPEPIEMAFSIWTWANVKHLEVNRGCRLRIFQDGGFTGVPDQVMQETVPIQNHGYGYGFSTKAIVINSLTPSAAEKQPLPEPGAELGKLPVGPP